MALVQASMAIYGDGRIARAADTGTALASGATGVSYSLDREQIPEVIADFQRALMSLGEAADEAQRHRNITPPGGDPHSSRAVRVMGADLVHGYLESNQRDQANIQAMIENLDAAMRQYDAREDEAARSLRTGVGA